jgi:chromosomal replication initiator protein
MTDVTHYLPAKSRRIEIIRLEVEASYNLKPGSLLRRNQETYVAQPRHIAFYLARTMTSFSLNQIGRFFCHATPYNHTSVLAGIRKVTKVMEEYSEVRDAVDKLRLAILEREKAVPISRVTPEDYLPRRIK